MTPQETAAIMQDTGQYSPLALNALTNRAMGYLPDAQYMTPSQYGAFRTLPQMAYQQPVNQTPGYFKSLALTTGIGSTMFYNPAASAIRQRAEASRYVSDTHAAVGSAIAGTAADLGMLALGLLPGMGVPMLAATLAGALLPIHLQGPQEHMANTRALQRLTAGKIVSGNSIDSVMGAGFSTRAARSIDTHLYRKSLDDILYDDEDYRRMLGEGIQSGMFDYANTPEQYKKILGNIRDNMSTLMEVAGSQNFEDAMKELKRLQDMGAQQGNFHSILRSENAYARMTGLSHSDLVNTYGQMGALEFAQRGLSNIQGSQVAMHNAAVVTMGQRSGTMSAAYVAAHGGMSGMAQDMTTQAGTAISKYQRHLLLAAIDPETGEIRKDFSLDNYTNDPGGLHRFMWEASKNASSITTGSDAALKMQNFERMIPDLIQKLQNKEGAATIQLSKMAEMIGRNSLQGREGLSKKDYMRAGLQTLGYKPDAAIDFVNSIDDIEKQFDYERKQDIAKTLIEFKKSNRLWSRAWRWFTTKVGGYWDDMASEVSDRALKHSDREALIDSGILEVQGLDHTLVASTQNAVSSDYVSAADRINALYQNAQRGTSLASVLDTQTEMATGKFGYKLGAKGAFVQDASSGVLTPIGNNVDCSGWVRLNNVAAMTYINSASPNSYSQRTIDMMNKIQTSDDIINTVGAAGGGVLKFGNTISESQLRQGMLIGIDTGKHDWEGKRVNGVDHIVQVYRDPQGEWWVTQSNSKGGGVNKMKFSEWQKNFGRNWKFFAGDLERANQNNLAKDYAAGELPMRSKNRKVDRRLFSMATDNGSNGTWDNMPKVLADLVMGDKETSIVSDTADVLRASELSYDMNTKNLTKLLGKDVQDISFNDILVKQVDWDSRNRNDFESSVKDKLKTYLFGVLGFNVDEVNEYLRNFDDNRNFRNTVIGAVLSSKYAKQGDRGKRIKDMYHNEFMTNNSKITNAINQVGLDVKDTFATLDESVLGKDKDAIGNVSAATDTYVKEGGTQYDAALIKSIAYMYAAYNTAKGKVEDMEDVERLGADIQNGFNLSADMDLFSIIKNAGTKEGHAKLIELLGGDEKAATLFNKAKEATGGDVDASKIRANIKDILKDKDKFYSLAVNNAWRNLNATFGDTTMDADNNFRVDVRRLQDAIDSGLLKGKELENAKWLVGKAEGATTAILSQQEGLSRFSYSADVTGAAETNDVAKNAQSAVTKTTVEDSIKDTATNTGMLVKLQEHTAAIMAYGVNSREADKLREQLRDITSKEGVVVAEQPKNPASTAQFGR